VFDIEALQMLAAETDETIEVGIWSTDVCSVFLSCFKDCP
jgi:hypothetical protein